MVAVLLLWGSWVPLATESNWIFSGRGPKPAQLTAKGVNAEFLTAGGHRYYDWIEPAAFASVSGPVVRAMFWRDHRTRGHMAPGYRHFLWQKSLHISVLPEITAWLDQHAPKDAKLAGGSLVAPAVALASGREIAAHWVDTNGKRFRSEMVTLAQFLNDICKDNVGYLVTSPSGFINDRRVAQTPQFRRHFRPVKRFKDDAAKFGSWSITLWERTSKEPCSWVP